MGFPELAGRRVENSVGEFHVAHDGSDSLIHLGLRFEDGDVVTIGCASDGQSVQVAHEILRDYDMSEYERFEVREFGLPNGSTISAAVPMVDEDQRRPLRD